MLHHSYFFNIGSSEYAQQLRLREEFLHVPLGIPFLPEYRQDEDKLWHLGAFVGERMIGTVLARFLDAEGNIMFPPDSSPEPMDPATLHAKIGQMVVHPDYRGHSIGRDLMVFMEQMLGAHGVKNVFLNSRDSAVGFYEKLGYVPEGDYFEFKTIPHLRMTKILV